MKSYVLCCGVALLAIACGGNSGGGGAIVDVSGTWLATFLNPDQATFNGCNGDFGVLNGFTFSEVVAAGPVCTTFDPLIVDQSGDTISSRTQFFACDNAVTYTLTGRGTVSGDDLAFVVTSVFSTGVIGRDVLAGRITGSGRILFEQSRAELAGAASGMCFITPPLQQSVQVF